MMPLRNIFSVERARVNLEENFPGRKSHVEIPSDRRGIRPVCLESRKQAGVVNTKPNYVVRNWRLQGYFWVIKCVRDILSF